MIKLLLEQASRNESGQVLLRSRLRAVSRRMGFSQVAREKIELVCSEMVTNQIKYAEGNGLVQLYEVRGAAPALDLFAMDYGDGIEDMEAAMKDGFSSSKTLGKGLGAIKRLAHECDFYSLKRGVVSDTPWHGTAVWARFYSQPAAPKSPYQMGSFMRALHDDNYNGDFIHAIPMESKVRWLHMDGLGHGFEAYTAVHGMDQVLTAEDSFEHNMENIDRRLQGTRGAVVILCEADFIERTLKICGVGDMSAYRICNGEKRSITFASGIMGYEHRSASIETLPLPPQSLFITTSDGRRKNWTLGSFPGLWRLHPQIISLVLAQVVSRGNDDRSIVTLRTTPQ